MDLELIKVITLVPKKSYIKLYTLKVRDGVAAFAKFYIGNSAIYSTAISSTYPQTKSEKLNIVEKRLIEELPIALKTISEFEIRPTSNEFFYQDSEWASFQIDHINDKFKYKLVIHKSTIGNSFKFGTFEEALKAGQDKLDWLKDVAKLIDLKNLGE